MQGTYSLKVRVEAPLGYIMGVADIVARHRLLSANITHFGHNSFL